MASNTANGHSTSQAYSEGSVHHPSPQRDETPSSLQVHAPSHLSNHTAPPSRSQLSREAALKLEINSPESAMASTFIVAGDRSSLSTRSDALSSGQQKLKVEPAALTAGSQANVSEVQEQPLQVTPRILGTPNANHVERVDLHGTRVTPRKRSHSDDVSYGLDHGHPDPSKDSDVQSPRAPPPSSRSQITDHDSKRPTQVSGDDLRMNWNPEVHSLGTVYVPLLRGWWWWTPSVNQRFRPGTARLSHAGRIMETTLGKQLFGDDRCARCIKWDDECWVYSDQVRQLQYGSNVGKACARCRFKDQWCQRPGP